MINSHRQSMVRNRLHIRLALVVALALSMLTISGCAAGSGATTPGQSTGAALPQASTPLPAFASWITTGDSPDRHFGFTVANAGDVNADGRADVIVCDDRYKQFVGRVYVYTGIASGLSAAPVFTATGETVNNHFGYAAGTAGDLNGDGYDDIVIGAYHWHGFRGRVYLYTASDAGLGGTPALILTGDAPNDYLGRSVAGANDVNGDGYDDVVMAAQGYGNYTGRVYLYTGGPNGLSGTHLSIVSGEGSADSFGESLAAAGDVNGDGYGDIIIGAIGYGDFMGRAYLYAGGPTGLSTGPMWIATGESADSSFGRSVAGAGDVNGDGYSDVIIGAPDYNNSTGRVYFYAGGPGGLRADPMIILTGEKPQDDFGWALAGAGDINGDRYDDVIVGAHRFNNLTGRTYLYLGGPHGLSATAALTLTGEEPNNFFGHSVAGVGDVNADGYDDFLVGAYGYDGSRGRVYLYLGKADGE
jgi:FG-GAP repeat